MSKKFTSNDSDRVFQHLMGIDSNTEAVVPETEKPADKAEPEKNINDDVQEVQEVQEVQKETESKPKKKSQTKKTGKSKAKRKSSKSENRIKVGYFLDADLVRAVKQRAVEQDMKFSDVITIALREYLASTEESNSKKA